MTTESRVPGGRGRGPAAAAVAACWPGGPGPAPGRAGAGHGGRGRGRPGDRRGVGQSRHSDWQSQWLQWPGPTRTVTVAGRAAGRLQ